MGDAGGRGSYMDPVQGDKPGRLMVYGQQVTGWLGPVIQKEKDPGDHWLFSPTLHRASRTQ